MAPSPIVQATLQTSILSAVANLLAQTITAHKDGKPLSIDWLPLFQFLLFTLISTPPNFKWQEFLESTFPAHPEPPAPHPKKSDEKRPASQTPPTLSLRNTLIKFFLDQTLAAAVNTLLFTTFIHSIRAAMADAPRITSFTKAASYWSSPGAIDFARVDFGAVMDQALDDFWPMLIAGAKLWPPVSIINFAFVKSVQARNLIGALAGVVWGVYICLVSGS